MPKKTKGDGIRLVMLTGPVQCHTPIVRSDLENGCPGFDLPYKWGTVRYRLDHVKDGVHVYVHEGVSSGR